MPIDLTDYITVIFWRDLLINSTPTPTSLGQLIGKGRGYLQVLEAHQELLGFVPILFLLRQVGALLSGAIVRLLHLFLLLFPLVEFVLKEGEEEEEERVRGEEGQQMPVSLNLQTQIESELQ